MSEDEETPKSLGELIAKKLSGYDNDIQRIRRAIYQGDSLEALKLLLHTIGYLPKDIKEVVKEDWDGLKQLYAQISAVKGVDEVAIQKARYWEASRHLPWMQEIAHKISDELNDRYFKRGYTGLDLSKQKGGNAQEYNVEDEPEE